MPPSAQRWTPQERKELQITGNIYAVGRGQWSDTPALTKNGGGNVWLIDGGTEMALIDAGMPAGVPDLIRNIQKLGLDPQKITKILVTHAHFDHIAALPKLCKILRCKVYAHKLCKDTVEGRPGIYQRHWIPPRMVGGKVHRVIQEGDRIRIGRVQVKVVAVPGHTPDGLAFELQQPDGTACFMGDTAIGDQSGCKGVIGWIDAGWNSRPADHKDSLEKLARPGYSAMLSGHGWAILGKKNVARSMKHCLWRLDLFRLIPNLGTMVPVVLARSTQK